MTFAIFIIAVVVLFFAFINILPSLAEYPLPIGFETALNTVLDYAYSFDFLFPIDTLLQVFFFALTFHFFVLFFRLLKWVVHFIRSGS